MKGCREVAIDLGIDVPEGPFLPVECCDSCHDDYNEGYDDLIWVGDDMQVCCAILRMFCRTTR